MENKNEKNKVAAGTTALALVATLFFIQGIFALSININVNPSFSAGDRVSFNYTLTSEVSENVSYVASVRCATAPAALVNIENASLQSNVPFAKTYIYISNLTNGISPQECTAMLGVLSPEEISANKTFSITTLPATKFNFNVCEDVRCETPARVFVSGNHVYFNYTKGVSISASVLLPDGSLKPLDLSKPLAVSETGTYTVEVNASSTGSAPVERQVQFGVISQMPDIGYSKLAAAGGNSGGKTGIGGIFFFVAAVIALFAALFLLVWFLAKKHKTPKKRGKPSKK